MGKIVNVNMVDFKANRELDEQYKTLLEREKRIESEIARKCQKEIDELNAIEAEKEQIERKRTVVSELKEQKL